VKELALAGIAEVEAANAFIRTVYIPAHNTRFAVTAEQEGSAFVAIPGVDLNEILCEQEDRQVGKGNTVAFNRLQLQIPPSPLRPHFVKARVKVRQYHTTHCGFPARPSPVVLERSVEDAESTRRCNSLVTL
jgi:hypothetical protein